MIDSSTISSNITSKIAALVQSLRKGVDEYSTKELIQVSNDFFQLVTLCDCVRNKSPAEHIYHACDLIPNRYDANHMPFCKCCQTRVFLDYLGRYIETRNMGGLTKARIRERTYAYEINGNKVRFEIVRHPGAFKEGYVKYRLIQKCEFDFDSMTIKEV